MVSSLVVVLSTAQAGKGGAQKPKDDTYAATSRHCIEEDGRIQSAAVRAGR